MRERMTEDEFFTELAKLPAEGWKAQFRRVIMRLDHLDHVLTFLTNPPAIWLVYRSRDGVVVFDEAFCPLTAVCLAVRGQAFFPHTPKKAAKALGLPKDIADTIIQAGDGALGHDPVIRARLLEALKLEEAAS